VDGVFCLMLIFKIMYHSCRTWYLYPYLWCRLPVPMLIRVLFWYQNEVDEEIKGVDSRDKVNHNERRIGNF